MPVPAIRRTVFSAQLLCRLGVEQGLSEAECLRDTGLSADSLSRAETEIRAAQEQQLIRNLLRGLPQRTELGLLAGLRYHLSAYGICGFAMLSSPSFRAAAEVAVRYLDLSFAFVGFALELSEDSFHVVLDDSGLPEDLRGFARDRDLAACCMVIQELRPGGLPLRALQLRGAAPPHAARYRELLGVQPEFGAARNVLSLARADVEQALPQADPLLWRLSQEQCRQLLARRRERGGVAGQVRDCLLQREGGMADIEGVAAELKLGSRSLRRYLEQEGTSFRLLVDEVRQILAEELLTVAHLKLEEVAQRLGYAEPASLIHAFKRWRGMTPAAYRRRWLRETLAQS